MVNSLQMQRRISGYRLFLPRRQETAGNTSVCAGYMTKDISIIFFNKLFFLNYKTHNYLHYTYSTYNTTLNTYSTYDTIQYNTMF